MSKSDLEKKAFTKIPEYMLEQNRPYSAIDVFTNLKQEFGKTLVLKVLESCVTSGILKDKVIGKQKIFYANQVLFDEVQILHFQALMFDKLEKYDEAAIADCDSKINSLSEEVKSLTAKYKDIQSALFKIDNMKARIAKLETSRDAAAAEDGKRALQAESAISKIVQKRKRLATDMLNAIMENSPLPKRELLDSMGVELD
ncbi:unnamed protein product [Haemonchus placei]|uniref:TBPIP domain-containing protein n=1 Tax=Haemonchus placei TaxID=6290 RepID=A0A0N4XB38_HAEPC|nr:unnamed protein product [Haemonchus placei]